MLLSEIQAFLDGIAPLRHAEPWDNVGLLVGDPGAGVSRVLMCIDLTPAVLAEAVSLRCELVVAYHPVVFEGVKRFVAGEMAYEAARRGIAVYSPHTAWDVAQGGTNDLLTAALGLTNVEPLKVAEGKSVQCKLVTFAPDDAADAVAQALFDAGAGQIGGYTHCSFRSPGVGTFFGGEGAKPAVGEAGRLERADEIRIEMVVPLGKVSEVVAALRRAHPYEEPAFDLNLLASVPEAVGIGRVGELDPAVPLPELVGRLKSTLGLSNLLVSDGGNAEGGVSRVAVCAGAGRSLVPEILRSRAGLYLTGELPHHDALRLARAGVSVICTLHSNSERGSLKALSDKLSDKCGNDVVVLLSERDRDPFSIV